MARPPDIEKKTELALRAAEVLEREGLGVSTERLAATLGVKRPTFLYHFPTLADVVETALVAVLSEQAAIVLAEIERHEHPIDRLFAQMRAVHAFHRGREARVVFLSQAIATVGGERSQEILARGTAVFAAHRAAAAARVRDGIARGEVAPCDADALVSTLRALVDGLMVQRVTDGVDLDAAHAFVWEHVLRPLKRTATSDEPRPAQQASAANRARARSPKKHSAPVKKSPVKKSPVTKPPVKKSPVTKPPVKKPPVKKSPVTKPPVTKPAPPPVRVTRER